MKKEIPNIDQLFKQKLDSQRFQMQSADWEKAMHLIKEKESNKKRMIWWRSVGVVVILLMSLGLTWILFSPSLAEFGRQEMDDSVPDRMVSNTTNLPTNDQHKSDEPRAKSSEENRTHLETDLEKIPFEPVATKSQSATTTGIDDFEGSLQKDVLNQESTKPKHPGSALINNLPSESKLVQVQSNATISGNSEHSIDKNLALLPRWDHANLYSNQVNLFTTNTFSSLPTNSDEDFVPRFYLGMNLESKFNLLESGESFWAGFGIGLLGRYKFTPRWSFDLGVLYEQRTSHSLYSELQEEIIYDFGVANKFYGMHAQSLHQIGLPLMLNRHVGDHVLQAGYVGGYLLGVQGDVEEVSLMPSNSPLRSRKVNEVVERIRKGWIDISPFSSWSHNLVVGYQYQISNGFYTGIKLNYRPGKILADAPQDLQNRPYSKFYLGVNLHLIIE